MNTLMPPMRATSLPLDSAYLGINAVKKRGLKAYLNTKPWFIRLTNKEYWNANIFFVPLVFYVIYLAIKARSAFFFSAANPAIPTGGLVGESKADIHNLIPPQYRPKTVVLRSEATLRDIVSQMEKAQLKFPIILKPVVGCRGLLVKKMTKHADIYQHLQQFNTDFLIEEFIDYPVEAAVLYWKNPETGKSGIESITLKEFLTVTGNGEQTIAELLMENPRGVLQVKRLHKEKASLMASIPQAGEKIWVEPIGNHCKGTKFLNFHLVTKPMVTAYDKIQTQLPGCYIYRLDLKAPSIADMQAGRDIKILEINGVGSDPAHIFDPKTPIFEMFHAYIRLWKKVFDIAQAVHRQGVPYMTYTEYKKYAAQQAAVEKLLL